MKPARNDSRGNVFIHPMQFDDAGRVVETDMIVISGKTMNEAVNEHFGAGTHSVGDQADLVGTASVVINDQIVSRRVYKPR